MFNQIIEQYAHVAPFDTRTETLKARLIYSAIAILSVMMTLFLIIGIVVGIQGAPEVPLFALGVQLVVYFVLRSGRLTAASWLLMGFLALIMVTVNAPLGILPHREFLIGALILLLAGFLLETVGIVVFTAVAALQVLLYPDIVGYVDNGSYDWDVRIIAVVLYVVMGAVVYAYNQFIRASRLTGQDLESLERLKLAEVNARITRQASARESLDSALSSTLDLILENYPEIYHAQVFLIDEGGIQAQLVASTGEAGQKLMAQSHSLAVGSLSVIGQTTFNGEPVIAKSGSRDSVHKVNELLPNTKLEAAFPLRVGDEIIGALDLQSEVLEDLSDGDRLTFQSLANSLSLAIDSIRQFDQAKARVQENQRLAEQTRTALREVERLNQRLIGRAWSEYAKSANDALGYAVDLEADETADYSEWSPTLTDAVQSKNIVQDGNVIAVPLRVRGQVIGAMEFELDSDQDFTPEDLELITEISDRFGLAAENTRLVEESQRTAQRETLINQITSRFQTSQNVESTLTEAARSLVETLNADNVKIRLGMPENSRNGNNGKGN